MIFIRNRLKYALNFNECTKILKQRLVKVDGKIRTDKTYPAGFMGEQICLNSNCVVMQPTGSSYFEYYH